ncbi:MAG: hypothetical protein M1828_006564 [Chrysothrix sp. TS-e1954]|nr:MAG: hypothetical protein M1828_006564 [Chrysothrix sp. TS-e1954]
MTNLAALTSQLNAAAADQCSTSPALPEDQRKKLLAACIRLKNVVTTPLEKVTDLVFAIHPATAVRLGMDFGIFDKFAQSRRESLTVFELAKDLQVDIALITRVMRLLTAIGIFRHKGGSEYVAEPIAMAYVDRSPLGRALYHFHDVHAKVLSDLPSFFRSHGYRNPNDSRSGPFQYTFNTDQHHFEWLKQTPDQFEAFNTFMVAQRKGRGEDWYRYFPIREKLSLRSKADGEPKITFVDVGGGFGEDLKNFGADFVDIDMRLVLQDLPETVAQVRSDDSRIECVAHDFFTSQTTRGAEVYYLRTILHDWPDEDARLILQHLHDAMSPSSMLLINEYIMPEYEADLHPALLDLSMMAMFSSYERTRSQWESLLRSAGLHIVEIWNSELLSPGSASLIQACI